jgi:acyl-lipid omega-6 desaturase (Delta-12 desaturase)
MNEPRDSRAWARQLDRYRKSDGARAAGELVYTVALFAAAWASMIWAVKSGHVGLYALLLLPTAGLLVRLFMIQHDCGHGAFFPNKRVNDCVGRGISVATLTPYDHWRNSHAIHHASSGNLCRRGIGDVWTLTVAEYLASSSWGRLRYRLYRHPLVMFGLGPLYLFVLQNRIPFGFTQKGWRPWLSTMATNAAIVGAVGLMIVVVGPRAFMYVQSPIIVLAASAGVWLFYVQHQFERTHWAGDDSWNARDAALDGSSYYELPKLLQWFTANIGVHHVHHLSSRIPFYRLPEVLSDYPELRNINRISLRQSLSGLRLALWDTERERLVSFKSLQCESNSANR